jgi:hypothetical protein
MPPSVGWRAATGADGGRAGRGAARWVVPIGAVVLAAACAAPGGAAAQEPAGAEPRVQVFATIEPDTATVGDRLNLRLRIERDPDVNVGAPDVAAAIAPLEVLGSARAPAVERGGRVVEERLYVVAAFETGQIALSPIAFDYVDAAGDTGSARTDSAFVTIVSVLPEDEEELAPKDIKPPIELPRRIWPFVLAAALAAAAVLGYRYIRAWWRRLRRPSERVAEEPAVPPRAAHLLAFERLEALRCDDPIGRGDIERFYVAVTDIVRRYLRDRFAVDAIDMTTAELGPSMLDARIGRGEIERTITYLARADLAKFAKLHPDEERARADFQEAWDLVERTRFRGEEAAADEAEEGP